MGQIILVGNEKGGAGKSTVCVHLALHCLKKGKKTAIIDLDIRQKSFTRFWENRASWSRQKQIELLFPEIIETQSCKDNALLVKEIIEKAAKEFDFIIIDTPGGDTEISRIAHGLADIIVTPMNDSFVDFDLLAKIDAVSGEIIGLNFYANQIWEARKNKALQHKSHLQWFVLRNRLSNFEARNKRKVGDALHLLSKRLGFVIIPGLSERVIYRELFPNGLSLLDVEDKNLGIQMSMSHVAARNELREITSALGI